MMHAWMIAVGTLLAVAGGTWEVARKVDVARHVPEASRWHAPFAHGEAWAQHEKKHGRGGAHAHTPMIVFLVGMGLVIAAVVRANF